jgi:F0F1-type ATP synthase gamma subunit
MAQKGTERVTEATEAVALARIATYQSAVLKGSIPYTWKLHLNSGVDRIRRQASSPLLPERNAGASQTLLST